MISNLFVPQFLHDHSKHFYLWYSKSVESQKYITELVIWVIRAHNFLAIVWPSAKQTSFGFLQTISINVSEDISFPLVDAKEVR